MPAHRLLHPRPNSRKLALLTDLEYRVWTQYMLSADDFGVMLRSALKLQSDSKALATRKPKDLLRCLDVLEKVELVHTFAHQGDVYLYQRTWQDYQRVTWPAKTTNPTVPPELLALCSPATQLLFSVHPGARKAPMLKLQSTAEVPTVVLQSTAGEPPDNSRSTSATRETLTLIENAKANANASEGSLRETQQPPMDAWFSELCEAYPAYRVTRGHMTQHRFVEQLSGHQQGPFVAWALMRSNLALSKASDEWRRGRMPKLETWLGDGRWLSAPPTVDPGDEQRVISTPKTAGNAAAIQRFIDRGKQAVND